MTLIYVFKLSPKISINHIRALKIYNFTFHKFGIVYTSFQVKNKFKKTCFFYKIFFVANTSIKLIYKISLLFFTNINIKFGKKKLI